MRFLRFLVLILLFGCAPYIISPESSYFAIDFTKYSKEGFLFTTEKYLGDYESIGLVEYVLVPGARKSDLGYQVDDIRLSQAIDSLYYLAKDMGADAIVNFDAKSIQREYSFFSEGRIILNGYELGGFAIKRK